ncbi:hypothetical protein [Aliidiomarina sanyensis]|uniref:Uncharacterized protein n=1 Tax=Aliidiomarina sanyensis TaxID=1249555 RepID=A0A432WGL5_9GAMM|nr:hypothetical protein [Aliidiomarina sanyensis]RUO32885.1 hypothetical protein CWE11_07600 [Aliidiomarina sanyensis]
MSEEKHDLAGSEEEDLTLAALRNHELGEKRAKQRVFYTAAIMSSILALSSFVMVFCHVANFMTIYQFHAHLGNGINETTSSLAPFLILFTPVTIFSTLFVITFIATMRFVAAYVNDRVSSRTEDSTQNQALMASIPIVAQTS